MFRHRSLKVVGALLVIAIAGWLVWIYSSHHRPRLLLTPQASAYPADGSFHRAFKVRRSDGRSLVASDVLLSGMQGRSFVSEDGSVLVEVQSPSLAGERRFLVQSVGTMPVVATLTFLPDSSDRFHDGTPEFLRLHTEQDRARFRGWFTALADATATLPASRLPKEVDDCAALLRWCYRNALHAHDEAWQTSSPLQVPPPLPSVQQYVWPDTPLGSNLFRVKPGAYAGTDAKDGAFSQFADAQTLMQRNTFLISRDLRTALPGDLLFYRQLEQNSPFHSMILTGTSAQWAVYDTGPIGKLPGEIRRVLVDDLRHHPDRQWRPNVDNENFLGVYRWNILRQDPR